MYSIISWLRRNISRFPNSFRFQLTDEETTELIANCDRLSSLKHSSNPPFAFTEQGVAMLSAVLNSPKAMAVGRLVVRWTGGGDKFEIEVLDQGEDFGGDGGGEVELFHIFVVLISDAKIRGRCANF
ncbi:MAG: ORF6N domain-containing protein [Bacteroidales bacterium]|nr:ORF6N domain-containing protein [Bacteroidales bacterium]